MSHTQCLFEKYCHSTHISISPTKPNRKLHDKHHLKQKITHYNSNYLLVKTIAHCVRSLTVHLCLLSWHTSPIGRPASVRLTGRPGESQINWKHTICIVWPTLSWVECMSSEEVWAKNRRAALTERHLSETNDLSSDNNARDDDDGCQEKMCVS